MNNILGSDLADAQLIRRFTKQFRFLGALLMILVNMLEVISLEDKEGEAVTKTFQKIVKHADRKYEIIVRCVNIEIYSRNSERKSMVAERFISFLKNKFKK